MEFTTFIYYFGAVCFAVAITTIPPTMANLFKL